MIRPSTSTGPATGRQGQVAINEFWENTNCVFKARLIANILSSSFTRFFLLRNDGEMPTTFERFPKCVSQKMVSTAKRTVQKVKRKQTSVCTFKGLLPKMISWNHPSLATSPCTTKKTQDKTSPQRYLFFKKHTDLVLSAVTTKTPVRL